MAQPQRTGDSLIFGVPARLTTTGDPRFMWSVDQIHTIVNWIQANPAGYNDLQTLLPALDLDGFTNDILDARGQRVRVTIERKVKEKLRRVRKQLASGWVPPAPPQNAHIGPGNAFIPGYNINIINPDGP